MPRETEIGPTWSDVYSWLRVFKNPHLRWSVSVEAYKEGFVSVWVRLVWDNGAGRRKLVCSEGGPAKSKRHGSAEAVALASATRCHERMGEVDEDELVRWAFWECETTHEFH